MPFLSPVEDLTKDATAGHEFAGCTVQRSNLEELSRCVDPADSLLMTVGPRAVYTWSFFFIVDRASNEVPWEQCVCLRDWKFMSKTRWRQALATLTKMPYVCSLKISDGENAADKTGNCHEGREDFLTSSL